MLCPTHLVLLDPATKPLAGSRSLLHCSPSPSSISSPSDKPHYEREKALRYPLLPPTPTAPWPWRERWRKKESGAKCERGLVSMPTAGGRTYAASQAVGLPARHLFFCPSCFLLACPPLLSALSVREIRLGPVPGIKPYLSSWG